MGKKERLEGGNCISDDDWTRKMTKKNHQLNLLEAYASYAFIGNLTLSEQGVPTVSILGALKGSNIGTIFR